MDPLLRQSDAVWIISEGVVAADLAEGVFELLPVDTSDARGSVGLTTRAGVDATSALEILMRTIRETVEKQRL